MESGVLEEELEGFMAKGPCNFHGKHVTSAPPNTLTTSYPSHHHPQERNEGIHKLGPCAGLEGWCHLPPKAFTLDRDEWDGVVDTGTPNTEKGPPFL